MKFAGAVLSDDNAHARRAHHRSKQCVNQSIRNSNGRNKIIFINCFFFLVGVSRLQTFVVIPRINIISTDMRVYDV